MDRPWWCPKCQAPESTRYACERDVAIAWSKVPKATVCRDCGRAPSTSGRKQMQSYICPKTGSPHAWVTAPERRFHG